MDYSTGIDYLKSKFAEERNNLKEHIAKGTLTPEKYQNLCGVIRGLDVAEQIVDVLAQHVLEEDADE